MSLKNLYLLRILQLEVYIDVLQEIVCNNFTTKLTNAALQLQQKLFVERKELRRFLNMTELWRFQ